MQSYERLNLSHISDGSDDAKRESGRFKKEDRERGSGLRLRRESLRGRKGSHRGSAQLQQVFRIS